MTEIIENAELARTLGVRMPADSRKKAAPPAGRLITQARFTEQFGNPKQLASNRGLTVAQRAARQSALANVRVMTPTRIPVLQRYGTKVMVDRSGLQLQNRAKDLRRLRRYGAALFAVVALGGVGKLALGNSSDTAPQGGNVVVGGAAAPGQAPSAAVTKELSLAGGKVICSGNPADARQVTVTAADKTGPTYSPFAAMERTVGTPQPGDFSYTDLPAPVQAEVWKDLSALNGRPADANGPAALKLGEKFMVQINCQSH